MPKQKSNAFMVFAKEWRIKNNIRASLQQSITMAGVVWKKMPEDQREIYKKRAELDTRTYSAKSAEKLTCLGTPLKEVENKELSKAREEMLMRREITTTVNDSLKRAELPEEIYYMISANYFVKTMEGIYIPAEISLNEFSLKDGNMNMYHTYVSPKVNLYALQYDTQQHSETTHRLPIPPDAMGTNNMSQIYYDILDFMKDKDANGKLKPIYTSERHVDIIKSILDYLQDFTDAQDITIKVYPIEFLFYALKEACCKLAEEKELPNTFMAKAVFERDYMEYQTGISCDFHESRDVIKDCTKSTVTRWGFMFADYMCTSIAITKQPGRHCPVNTKHIASDTGPIKEETTEDETFTSANTSLNSTKKQNKTFNKSATASGGDMWYDVNGEKQKKWKVPEKEAKKEQSKRSNYSLNARNSDVDIQHSLKTLEEDVDDASNAWSHRSRRPPPLMPSPDCFDVRDDSASICSSVGRGTPVNPRNPFNGSGRGGRGRGIRR